MASAVAAEQIELLLQVMLEIIQHLVELVDHVDHARKIGGDEMSFLSSRHVDGQRKIIKLIVDDLGVQRLGAPGGFYAKVIGQA